MVRWRIQGSIKLDQIAVLVGVRGESGGFRFEGNMTGRLRNGFTWTIDGEHRSYARPTESNDFYLAEIESLMTLKP